MENRVKLDTYCLFIDDSGSSCPNKVQATRNDGMDTFALGGYLIKESDVDSLKCVHKEFMILHGLECPVGSFDKMYLHSTRIRCRKGQFEWLNDETRAKQFYCDLDNLIKDLPLIGVACVINRPCYQERYGSKYSDKWQLCRSAYQILLERAVKYVRSVGGGKLLVFVEKTGKKEDERIQGYHDKLITEGMGFDQGSSAKYQPMSSDVFAKYLTRKVTFQTKNSRPMQIADLLLYPLIKGGYDETYPPYQLLRKQKLVIDYHVEDPKTMGVKYYCFD